jgi:hypothetical protein
MKHRLRRIERGLKAGERCAECGAGGPIHYEVYWGDESMPEGPEYCPSCGEQLIVTVRWPEDPDCRPAQRARQVWP